LSIVKAKPTRNARTNRLYTRLTAAEVRRQLLAQKGYTDEELPTEETLANKLNELGYYPRGSGQKSAAKKIPETDAIFAQVKQVNEAADTEKQTLRISMDAKAALKVGPFGRGGKSRVTTKAADHDAGGSCHRDASGYPDACHR
jgi:hypothetical protein